MTGTRDQESGVRGTESGAAASPVFILGAVVLGVLPVFAHGCHRGDHDDEPATVPVEQRSEPGAAASVVRGPAQ